MLNFRLLSVLATVTLLTGCIHLPSQDTAALNAPQTDEMVQRMQARADYERAQSKLDASLEGHLNAQQSESLSQPKQPPKPKVPLTAYEHAYVKTQNALFDICIDRLNKFYFDKTPCLASQINQRYLAMPGRPTVAERKKLKPLFDRMQQLNQSMLQAMLKSRDPELIKKAQYSQSQTQPKILQLQNQLLSGHLTWAQYNQRRRALFLGL